MDTDSYPSGASGSRSDDVPEVHNASVDAKAARQGGCGQVHLQTGRMCTLRHGHQGSCEFSPAGQADALLAERKAVENW
jgi:hypothetical protein